MKTSPLKSTFRSHIQSATIAMLAIALTAVSVNSRGMEPDWFDVELPGSPGADLAAHFADAGFEADEAQRLAELLTFGADAMDSDRGCQYYAVTTVWCDGHTRYHQRTNVGTTCIEAGNLQLRPVMNCPIIGQEPRFKSTTAATCLPGIPGATCVFVGISGPYSTDVQAVCDALKGCGCWPNLACSDRECTPVAKGLPTSCPNCN